ncbi:MAG TPA: hypothetical protein VNN07_01855 [Candidatus Tectomicrobia bacterium]|nr:hypothetical protein [Candidatus Tectomicrobia bacterium]
MVVSFAGTRLRMELDRWLWRGGDHVAIRQLAEDFARYLYLPRLKDPNVLLGAVRDGMSLLTWEQDTFAIADSFDETAGRYLGLRAGQTITLTDMNTPALLVRSAVARRQFETERAAPPPLPTPPRDDGTTTTTIIGKTPSPPPPPTQPKRFHGTVSLDPTRVGRDAGRIAEEVIAHLTGLIGAKVTVTLEIQAEIPSGAPDHVIRTVTENSRTLKFTSHGFEQE